MPHSISHLQSLHFEHHTTTPTIYKYTVTNHGYPVAIPRPHCTGALWRDRDRSHRLWYVSLTLVAWDQTDKNTSGVHLLGFLGMVRHGELRALPRLLDGVCGRALSGPLTDLLPSAGASPGHSGGGGDHDDLLVCWVHCYRRAVTASAVLPHLRVQLPPGGHDLWGI